MSELMAVGQALTMSSREIAELTGKRHDHVLRDVENMLQELGQTSPHFWGELPDSYNRPQRVAFLSKDLSITLVAGYSVQMRHAIVCRWQELEAAQAKPPAQLSRMEILELAMQAEQGRIEAEKKLALAAPKVEFVDKFVQASTGSKTFRQVAKLLKANEREFRAFLEDFGVMYRLGGEWMPYAQHLDAGRFEVKTGVAGNEHAYTATRFTAKGVEWIAGEWAKHQVALVTAQEEATC